MEPRPDGPEQAPASGPVLGRLPETIAAIGIAVGLVAAGMAGVRMLWPTARIDHRGATLARLEIAPFGEHVSAAAVVLGSGRWQQARVTGGVVSPVDRLPTGARVRVVLTIRRSGWLGWLVGSTEHVHVQVLTPSASPRQRLLDPTPGEPITVSFSSPVSAVTVAVGQGRRRLLRFERPRRVVPLGPIASGASSGGTALVAGAPTAWERVPPPVRVTWLPRAQTPEVLVRPRPQTRLTPTTPIVLTFSHPTSSLLGGRRPVIWPRAPGVWREPDDHTLVFQPTGLGYPVGASIRLGLTRPLRVLGGAAPTVARTLSWRVPAGLPQRLEQILAQLDYLPLRWRPAAGADPEPLSPSAAAAAALDPPTGRLVWRHGEPASLRNLWNSAAGRPVLVRGAIMAFEAVHGLSTDGLATPLLWRVLLRAELRGTPSPYGYSYVFVSETLPETLTLWHNGRVVLRTPVNTGIPGRATALGTYPVYLHLAATTMSGTNPDGTHYSDPGVPWVNYFDGGDAVHGFIRPGYGYPQSLGCVEAPISTAAVIWPFVQVGTLVTVVT